MKKLQRRHKIYKIFFPLVLFSLFSLLVFLFFATKSNTIFAQSTTTKKQCANGSCITVACDFNCNDACFSDADCAGTLGIPGVCPINLVNCSEKSCQPNGGCPSGQAKEVTCDCPYIPGTSPGGRVTYFECCGGGGGVNLSFSLDGHIFNDQDNDGIYSSSEPHLGGFLLKYG